MIRRSKFYLQEPADELAELDHALEASAGGDRGQNGAIPLGSASLIDRVDRTVVLALAPGDTTAL